MVEEPPPPPEDLGGAGYRVVPRPKPHQTTATAGEGRSGRATTSEAELSGSKTKKAVGATGSQVAGKTAEARPLTPAEIRTAVPAQTVGNPKQTLSSAQIKSLWGDTLGRVHAVDMAGGKLKAVDANVVSTPGGKSKIVRIDPARLKYVRSRNLLVTTMSKPDLAKLPSADNP